MLSQRARLCKRSTYYQVVHFLLFGFLFTSHYSGGFQHTPCRLVDQAQFQLPGCYIPPHASSLLFSEAAFLMSHDAATGYIRAGDWTKTGLAWPYAKNQVGGFYQQLQDGARALDLRPKLLTNGTVIFQHGSLINIHVSLEQAVAEVVKWCAEHGTDELVLLLSSNFAYEDEESAYYYGYYAQNANEKLPIVQAMSDVYEQFGVTYLQCNDVYGMTMGQVMELAALPGGGYLLALDGQDYYGTFCGKMNWVTSQLVTCWGGSGSNSSRSSCRTSSIPLQKLTNYVLQSANNPASDDRNTLGPPNNRYDYPLNEIQALWQVDGRSAAIGMAHFSSILEDNRQSQVNKHMVDLIYNENFHTSPSLFAVDNVALNGNALLSVLRTACGQSNLDVCGKQLDPPRITYFHVTPRGLMRVMLALYLMWFVSWLVMKKIQPRWLMTLYARFQDAATSGNKDRNGNDDIIEEEVSHYNTLAESSAGR